MAFCTSLNDSTFLVPSLMDPMVLRESLARLMSIPRKSESNTVSTKQDRAHLIHRALKRGFLVKRKDC